MLLKKHHHHYPHNLTQANSNSKMDYFLFKQKANSNNSDNNKKSGCCCCSSTTNNNNNIDLKEYHHNQNYNYDHRRRSTNITSLNSSFIESYSSSPIKLQTNSKSNNNFTTANSVSSLAASLSKNNSHSQHNRHTFLNNINNYSSSIISNSGSSSSSKANANQSIESDCNYFYSPQRHHQPCIVQPRSHSKSKPASSSIQKLVKLELVKSRNINSRLVPSSSGLDFNRKNPSHHSTSNTQNYLIKYPNTSTVFPCSKSSGSIKSLYFSNSNNNSNVKLANTKQDVNVYDEIITSDQEEENEENYNIQSQNRISFSRKNSSNEYELLSNLNSSINSNNTSLNSSTNRQTNRRSMICMNNNRINSLTNCNSLHNKITSTINCFKSFGQNIQKQMPTVTQDKSYSNSAIRYHHANANFQSTIPVVPPPVPPSLPPPKIKQSQQSNLVGGHHQISNSKAVSQYDSSPTSILSAVSDHCDSISSCSSSISSKSIFFAKNSPTEQKKSKSPAVSSGYNSSQDQESSFFAKSCNKANKSNYNSTILSYVGLNSRDYLASKNVVSLNKPSDDSGVSTMHEKLSKDYYEHDDSTTSNISSFFSSDTSNLESSSISMSCVSNSSSGFYNGHKSDASFDETNSQSVDYMHLSPFPRVKTCLIAQIKHLESNGNSTDKKTSLKNNKINFNKNEPLYENLTTAESFSNKKNYSIHDILQSLNSLELQNNNKKSKKTVNKYLSKETEEDLLCDNEVQFYLNRVENCSSLNEQHQYQFADTSIASAQSPIELNRSFNHNSKQSHVEPKSLKIVKNNHLTINRPIAFWEQLV